MRLAARYKAALAAAALAAAGATRAERVAGAALPDDARQVEPGRYRVGRSYEDALKFFKAVYPPGRFPRKPIANQPGIRAVHIQNPEARPGTWEGLNVYEIRGETRVFVLVTPGKEAPRSR